MSPIPLDPSKVNRDVTLLWNVFLVKVNDALADCHDNGLILDIFEGFRLPQRQAWLYAQGRTAPGKIVTNAREWQSWHQFGLAVDVVFKDDGGNWIWQGDYDTVEKIFLSHGLEKGPRFEHAHFELTGGVTLFNAKGYHDASGLPWVWQNVADAISAN